MSEPIMPEEKCFTVFSMTDCVIEFRGIAVGQLVFHVRSTPTDNV